MQTEIKQQLEYQENERYRQRQMNATILQMNAISTLKGMGKKSDSVIIDFGKLSYLIVRLETKRTVH